jgi:hypothetical protein
MSPYKYTLGVSVINLALLKLVHLELDQALYLCCFHGEDNGQEVACHRFKNAKSDLVETLVSETLLFLLSTVIYCSPCSNNLGISHAKNNLPSSCIHRSQASLSSMLGNIFNVQMTPYPSK